MSRSGGFDDNDQLPPGLYSQLLFGDDEISEYLEFTTTNSDALDTCNKSKNNGATNGDESNSDVTTQKMLCFGDYAEQEGDETACMGSNGVKLSSSPDSRRKRNGLTLERNVKRSKADNSAVTGHAKIANKKQKLGDRIMALQQLVSPFGKTDTASVLHEALGYIRFLQDQVQVLCSPYLQRQSHSPSTMPCPNHENGGGGKKENKGKGSDDLKSRGLCLVPVELTLHVADSNGADLWSTASHGQPSLF